MITATQDENGGESIRVAFTLPKEVDRAIEVEAARLDMTKSGLVVAAVERWLKEKGTK